MAGEIRHCERCDHEFEVEVTPAAGGNKVEGCPDTAAADCGLPKPTTRMLGKLCSVACAWTIPISIRKC